MRISRLFFNATAMLLLCGPAAQMLRAATVTEATLQGWKDYIQWTKLRLAKDAAHPDTFLYVDRHPNDKQKIEAGGVVALHAQREAFVPVPNGLIHDWIGALFVPNTDLRSTLAVLEDYDRYSETYAPGVASSKLLDHNGDEYVYELKFIQKGFGVKAGLFGKFHTSYVELNDCSGYSTTDAMDMAELANPGTPEEHRVPLQAARGYVENVFTEVRYREGDGGVYMQVESITLSRDIPGSVRWMVSPMVQKFSRQTMTQTLDRLRNRVLETSSLNAAKTR